MGAVRPREKVPTDRTGQHRQATTGTSASAAAMASDGYS